MSKGFPDYLEIVVKRGAVATATEVAEENVVVLDSAMKEIYQKSLETYKKQFRERVPILFALFNESGGQYVLWPPDRPAILAPPPPALYALAKSVAHSALAIYSCLAPYLGNPQDASWRGPLEHYLTRIKTARKTTHELDAAEDVKVRFNQIYDGEIAFMESALATGEISLGKVKAFARELQPMIAGNIASAAQVQVDHWMGVLKGWKQLLGADWDRMYAVTNTLYVTRRNNIHFTILANVMGREAINTRLLLIEGTSFEAPLEQLFDVLTRIVADRAVGEVFFNNAMVMDSELIWEGAREAISEGASSEYPAQLPPVSPLLSHEWPWVTHGGEGPAGLVDLGIYTPRATCPHQG